MAAQGRDKWPFLTLFRLMGQNVAFFRPMFFFAPCLHLMRFTNSREVWGSTPKTGRTLIIFLTWKMFECPCKNFDFLFETGNIGPPGAPCTLALYKVPDTVYQDPDSSRPEVLYIGPVNYTEVGTLFRATYCCWSRPCPSHQNAMRKRTKIPQFHFWPQGIVLATFSKWENLKWGSIILSHVVS